MLRLTIILRIAILTSLLTSCKYEKYEPSDISGTWYSIFRDSTYDEVIITKNALWRYTDDAGTIFRNYIINNDTIEIKRNNYKARLVRKGIDEFDLVSKNFTTHYFRLEIQLDTTGLLSDDENVLSNYINDWRARKHNWETGYKLRKN